MLTWLRRMFTRAKDDRGFTLIELIVVIVIIGILAAVAIPAFTNRSDDAKRAAAQADLQAIGSAIDLYYANKGYYPWGSVDEGDLYTAAGGSLVPDYLRNLPKDPWGNEYHYNNASGDTYTLWSTGGDGNAIYYPPTPTR